MQVPGDGTLPPPFLLERLYLIKTVLLIRRLEELIRCWGYYVTRILFIFCCAVHNGFQYLR